MYYVDADAIVILDVFKKTPAATQNPPPVATPKSPS
jgi:hypothetical protein